MGESTSLKRILILDDDADFRALLKSHLGKLFSGVDLQEYDPVARGVPGEDFDWSRHDVLILDYYLCIHNVTGLDILQANRKNKFFPATIMLTGAGSEEVAVRAVKAGVYDYLRKEKLDKEQLRKSILNAFEEHKEEQQRLSELTNQSLAFNKALFYQKLEKPGAEEKQDRILMLIELDDARTLEDRVGSILRDNIVRHLAQRSFEVFQVGECHPHITRLGDTAVAMLIDKPASLKTLQFNMEGLCAHLRKRPYKFDDKKFRFTVSIGVTEVPHTGGSAEKLIAQARRAVGIAAATADKNSFHVFTAADEPEPEPDQDAGAAAPAAAAEAPAPAPVPEIDAALVDAVPEAPEQPAAPPAATAQAPQPTAEPPPASPPAAPPPPPEPAPQPETKPEAPAAPELSLEPVEAPPPAERPPPEMTPEAPAADAAPAPKPVSPPATPAVPAAKRAAPRPKPAPGKPPAPPKAVAEPPNKPPPRPAKAATAGKPPPTAPGAPAKPAAAKPASDDIELDENTLGEEARRVYSAFVEKRVVQTFQPIMPLFNEEGVEPPEVYRVHLQFIDRDGSVKTEDYIYTEASTPEFQKYIDRWLLRETIGRVVNHPNNDHTFLIRISEASLADPGLFNWLRKLLGGLDKRRPGKYIALEMTASEFGNQQKKASALMAYLGKSQGFRFALAHLVQPDEARLAAGEQGIDLLRLGHEMLEKLKATPAGAGLTGSLLDGVTGKSVQLIVDDIQDATTLTNVISAGAHFAMGNFIGEPMQHIDDSTNVQSFEIT